jgi:ribosomal peptide maturation radical SAM protein 1
VCRISLVNMPFADAMLPSIALTQLKSVVLSDSYLTGVSVDIAYANNDFALHFGMPTYRFVTHSNRSLYAGLGDWIFRRAAFPLLADNSAEYLQRFFSRKSEATAFVSCILSQHLFNIEKYAEEVIDRYSLDQSNIVGFTSMFMQNMACFALARTLKRRNPKVIIVMGGANCEFPMGQIIADQVHDIDYVFSGPSLKSFPLFVRCYLDNHLVDAAKIPGILVDSESCSTPKQETVGEEFDINTRIKLDYEEFSRKLALSSIGAKETPIYPFETSRGCWWGQRAHCAFCGLNGASMSYRAMRPEAALEQFDDMFRHSDQFKQFNAVDNILPRSYLKDVFPSLSPPKDVRIFYEVKADLSEEEIAILERAGVRAMQPGIESLATSTLKLMKKGTTAPQNIRLLKACALYGIRPAWNLLVGFPGEGVEVYRRYLKVLPLLVHLEPPIGVFPIRFDRFSPYHSHSADYGLKLEPMDFYPLIYPFDAKTLRDFAYYFSDRNVLTEYSVAVAKWIGKLEEVVSKWRARWTGAMSPNLYFVRKNSSVCDTRSGKLLEHHVGKLGISVLEHLARGVRKESVISTFSRSGENENEVATVLMDLQGKGLIFEEDGRLLSLVLEGERGEYAGRSEMVGTSELMKTLESKSTETNEQLVILR